MSDRWDWQVDDEWDRAERANDRMEWADHLEAWRVARDDVLTRDAGEHSYWPRHVERVRARGYADHDVKGQER